MKKIGIIIGHNVRQQGAESPVLGRSEFEFNSEVAQLMLATRGYENDYQLKIFTRKYVGSTGLEIRNVYRETDDWGADLTLELHYNAFTSTSTGTETLSSGSKGSLAFAADVQAVMLEVLGLSDRGVKTVKSGSGAVNLSTGRAPAILVEPFFGSNPSDSAKAKALGAEGFAQMYLAGIRRHLKLSSSQPVPSLPADDVPAVEADWYISGSHSKAEFIRTNSDAIEALVGRVNGWLAGRVAISEINPLTVEDFVTLTFAEAAIKPDGGINVNATHSNGEEGLFPLPDNISTWIGEGWETQSAEGNIIAFAHYLGALKNSEIKASGSNIRYRDLYANVKKNRQSMARVLAAAVHGSFYAPNFSVDLPESSPDFLVHFAVAQPSIFVLLMSELGFKSAFALNGRMKNIFAAEELMATMG